MGTVGWLLAVALGIALGFSVGRIWPGHAGRITALERERDTAREELRTYRKDVGTHFERTAQLFDKVTADYRGLYEHLATSARQLGAVQGEPIEMPLAEPERRRLAQVEFTPPDVPAPEAGEPSPDETEVGEDTEWSARVDVGETTGDTATGDTDAGDTVTGDAGSVPAGEQTTDDESPSRTPDPGR